MHPARLPIDALLDQCEERRLRRSGPGGQNRNKVETAVVLLHTPTGISAEANERRSQQQNREVATTRLRVRLAVEWREAPEPSPSCLWLSRCKGGKLSVSEEHDDFPALLAEALDQIAAADWDEAAAAPTLAVTRTQLVNLLRQSPPALTRLNQERTTRNRPQVR